MCIKCYNNNVMFLTGREKTSSGYVTVDFELEDNLPTNVILIVGIECVIMNRANRDSCRLLASPTTRSFLILQGRCMSTPVK